MDRPNYVPISRERVVAALDAFHTERDNKNLEIRRIYQKLMDEFLVRISHLSYTHHMMYFLTEYDPKNPYKDNVISEFICVMCSLTLSVKKGVYFIELDTSDDIGKVIGEYAYRNMLRSAYRYTMWENTQHCLEDLISIDTNILDHYNYFLTQLKNTSNPNTIIDMVHAIIE